LEHRLQYYIDKQYEFDWKLRQECPDDNEDLEVPEVVEEVSPDAEIVW
jgi:hypothetical protein